MLTITVRFWNQAHFGMRPSYQLGDRIENDWPPPPSGYFKA